MARYCTADDLYLYWGRDNVREAADLDSLADDPDSVSEQDARIDERIEYMCENACNWIDSMLLDGPYKIPFDEVPGVIREMATEDAFIRLRRPRLGEDDVYREIFATIKTEHLEKIVWIKTLRMRFNIQIYNNVPQPVR